MTPEQRGRLESMTDPSSGTWDLSDNDIQAIKAALAYVDQLEAQLAEARNAALEEAARVVMMCGPSDWVQRGADRIRSLKSTPGAKPAPDPAVDLVRRLADALAMSRGEIEAVLKWESQSKSIRRQLQDTLPVSDSALSAARAWLGDRE